MAQEGYRTPSSNAHYPQGLLSCLYQLRSRIPVNFDLLTPGDVVVYDRGYYSFQLLHAHAERRLQAVFRLQRNASALFGDFILGDRTDHTVTVTPSADALRQRPQAAFQPCRVRLIKYTAGTTTYTLATTRLFTNRSEESFRADPGKTVERILAGIAACRQRQRPNRSFPRLSRKPASKWRSSKATATATTA